MDSIDRFITCDDLCQAIECIKNILDENIVKTSNQKSTTTGSDNLQYSSSLTDGSNNSKATSSGFVHKDTSSLIQTQASNNFLFNVKQ